ncbi:MAG TPA: tetratricopeptide repeat protein, partial [Vicinamibacterales bacterium]|nr:tetratricopeptide repeat protein [Vicinamibacterales bacterium]
MTRAPLLLLLLALLVAPAGAQSHAGTPRAHYLLGRELERQQNLDAAAAEYRAALERAPNLAAAHDRLGFLLGLQGHTAEAIAEFEKAVALQP